MKYIEFFSMRGRDKEFFNESRFCGIFFHEKRQSDEACRVSVRALVESDFAWALLKQKGRVE